MANLGTRVIDFINSLSEFKDQHAFPSWQTGQLFNGLLAMAKDELKDDPVIQAISPATKGSSVPGALGREIAEMDIGTMKAVMTQILSALGETGPAIA